MDAERQLIGSLLMDGSRANDVGFINADMFSDGSMGLIYALYEQDKGINHIDIIKALTTDYRPSDEVARLITELVDEHDPAISDRWCAKEIYDNYRVRKFDELLSHTRVDTSNIDQVMEDFKNLIDSLPEYNDNSQISTLSQLVDEYKDEYFKEKPNKIDLTFGFHTIDEAIGGIDDGDVVVIAARPAVGKSALALQLIRRFGRKNLKIGYFNLEMSKKQVYERAVASSSHLSLTRIRLGINFQNDEQERFDKGNSILKKENNVYVIQGSQSIKSIRQIQNKYNFDVIVIDYLQLIIPGSGRKGNRVAEVGDISRGLKALATDFEIPVLALSQLNRTSEHADDKEPYMSDLRESGDIEQDASVIVMLWNCNPEDICDKGIKVEKSRNGYTKKTQLTFDGKTVSFVSDDPRDTDENNGGFVDVDNEELPFL